MKYIGAILCIMEINYVAILASTAVSLVVGMLWYGPMMFGRFWLRVTGLHSRNEKEVDAFKRRVIGMYGMQILVTFLQFYILSIFIHATNETLSWSAVTLMLWAGFIIPIHTTSVIWDNVPSGMRFNKVFVGVIYELVIMMISAYMMVHWGEL